MTKIMESMNTTNVAIADPESAMVRCSRTEPREEVAEVVDGNTDA